MIENPLESRQTNRLAQLEASINWPTEVGPHFFKYFKENQLEEFPLYTKIGAIIGEEGSILRQKLSRGLLLYTGSSEDKKFFDQLVAGYADIFDIIFEAELIDASDNQFDDYDMSALEQVETHLRRNSILKLVTKDPTGVKLLEWNRETLGEDMNIPEGIKRGYAKGYRRYMQILNYFQEQKVL